jgi:hypothetical protein
MTTLFIPGAEHVEVPYEKPGLCPECLNLQITGRGGGQVQLLERDGKWVCPRSGPSLTQQYAREGVDPAAAFGVGMGIGWMVFPTFAFSVGGGWLLWNWLRRKKGKPDPL